MTHDEHLRAEGRANVMWRGCDSVGTYFDGVLSRRTWDYSGNRGIENVNLGGGLWISVAAKSDLVSRFVLTIRLEVL